MGKHNTGKRGKAPERLCGNENSMKKLQKPEGDGVGQSKNNKRGGQN